VLYDGDMLCPKLYWSCDAIARVDWLDVVRTAVTLITAYIAYKALQNWRRQDKAKREAEFLDELIEAVHAYIADIGRSVTLVDIARIGMRSHSDDWDAEDDLDPVTNGAVAYIASKGDAMSRRLFDALNEVRSRAVRLRALGTKGQIFGFDGYDQCHQAITLLCWQFDRIEALAGIIGSTTLNWQNPDVVKTLNNVLTITPENLQHQLAKNNVVVLEFAQTTYRTLYRR
jgi:hypothetical protein